MKKTGNIFLMLVLALSLTACPGKNSDSNGSAATPDPVDDDAATVSCQWSWSHNNYIDEDGDNCTPTDDDLNNANYCHNYVYNWSTNKWTDKKGKEVKCVQGYIDFSRFQPYQYYYGSYQANCSLYGYGWYPMQFGNSLVCVKQNYVNSYFPGYNFYNPSNYYYPTTCRYGVDCHTRCGGLSAGGSFGGLWFGGTLGMCQ